MDLASLIELIKLHAPQVVQYVLMGLGVLVCAGMAYIKATPTQDDDAFLQKMEGKAVVGQLLKLLIAFSPLERKDAQPK